MDEQEIATKRFLIQHQEDDNYTQIAEADTIEEAIKIICNGLSGDKCIVIMDTVSGKHVIPDQKMLRKLYKKSKKFKKWR